ncbi:MAG: hypothetical protein R3F43_02575 [bacterium]
MHRSVPRAPLFAALLLVGGCAFDGQDVAGWATVAGGNERLAGYLIDADRPLPLRYQAAEVLVAKDELPHLLAAVRQAPDEAVLAGHLAEVALDGLADAERAGRSAALAYLLLERPSALADQAEALALALADWGVAGLPMTAKALTGPLRPDMAVLGAAQAVPVAVRAKVLAAAGALESEEAFLELLDILAQLRDPAIQEAAAGLLLARARQAWPAVSPALAAALRANGNETLLRFLLELTRDPRQSPKVRGEGFNASRRLGPAAIPGLLRILATDLPADDDARWLALRDIWEKGGPASLAAALRALPAEGQWPQEAASFKDEIEGFCDNRLATKAEEVRPVLTELVQDPNWVARAFAMACIVRLYPDDAAGLLKPLRRDQTALPGWSEEGEPMTFATAVKRLGR